MKEIRYIRLAAILAVVLLISGCDQPPQPDTIDIVQALSRGRVAKDCYEKADRQRTLAFPLDFGAHPSFQTEWWYYTGNLTDAFGRAFGFQLTFFRNALDCSDPPGYSAWRFRQIYFAHFAVTDIQGRAFYSAQRMNRGSLGLAGARSDPFRVWIDNWAAEAGTAPDRLLLKAGERMAAKGKSLEKQIAIRLNLVRTKPVILQGEGGWSKKGPGPSDASYYYSFPGLGAEGSIFLRQEEFRVSGRIWFDHEWSTSALGEDVRGWDWFALHLTGGAHAGTDLMVCQVRNQDGRPNGFGFGSISSRDGQIIHLKEKDFSIIPQSFWKSPLSGKTYPARWNITIPGQTMAFDVSTLIPDQEHPHDFSYYEGAVDVTGKGGTGSGYVEMTGYEPE